MVVVVVSSCFVVVGDDGDSTPCSPCPSRFPCCDTCCCSCCCSCSELPSGVYTPFSPSSSSATPPSSKSSSSSLSSSSSSSPAACAVTSSNTPCSNFNTCRFRVTSVWISCRRLTGLIPGSDFSRLRSVVRAYSMFCIISQRSLVSMRVFVHIHSHIHMNERAAKTKETNKTRKERKEDVQPQLSCADTQTVVAVLNPPWVRGGCVPGVRRDAIRLGWLGRGCCSWCWR